MARIPFLISNMSGVIPFQFEPTYPPGKEPVVSEEDNDEANDFDIRVGNTEWCFCGGNGVPMSTADECFSCQESNELSQTFDESGVECITIQNS